jgi:hypothetical protein
MQLGFATVSFAMQLTTETVEPKEAPMRAISLIAPTLLAETNYLDLIPEQIARSVQISEQEILDDLLYPADPTAPQS